MDIISNIVDKFRNCNIELYISDKVDNNNKKNIQTLLRLKNKNYTMHNYDSNQSMQFIKKHYIDTGNTKMIQKVYFKFNQDLFLFITDNLLDF